MAQGDGRSEGRVAHPGVDYSYLFGCRHTTVRHDPHVRSQTAGVVIDLRGVSGAMRGQGRDR